MPPKSKQPEPATDPAQQADAAAAATVDAKTSVEQPQPPRELHGNADY